MGCSDGLGWPSVSLSTTTPEPVFDVCRLKGHVEGRPQSVARCVDLGKGSRKAGPAEERAAGGRKGGSFPRVGISIKRPGIAGGTGAFFLWDEWVEKRCLYALVFFWFLI